MFCAIYRTIDQQDTTTIWRIMQCAMATSTVFITDSITGKYNTLQGLDTPARATKNNKN